MAQRKCLKNDLVLLTLDLQFWLNRSSDLPCLLMKQSQPGNLTSISSANQSSISDGANKERQSLQARPMQAKVRFSLLDTLSPSLALSDGPFFLPHLLRLEFISLAHSPAPSLSELPSKGPLSAVNATGARGTLWF